MDVQMIQSTLCEMDLRRRHGEGDNEQSSRPHASAAPGPEPPRAPAPRINAVNLNSEELPASGMTAWIYDSNFDGYADKAEYLGPGVAEPVPERNGTLTVNWLHRDKTIIIGAEPLGEGSSRVLGDINAAMQ